MKRNLVVLAVAAAITAPAAMAQSQSSANPVTLYGGLRVAFESVKSDGGSSTEVTSRNRVSNQLSYLGIRGTEVINSDLTAFFQIESGIAIDSGDSTLASRNSAVGLRGNWGTVLLGRWDTPYKNATNVVDPFHTMQLAGMTAVMSDAGNFDLWPSNTVQYWSPTFSNFSFRAHYSANESKTAAANPNLYSFSGVYDAGPLYFGYSYEEHKNRVGADSAAVRPDYKESSNALFAKYDFGQVWISVLAQDFKKTNLTKQKALMVAANYSLGASQFKLSIQSSKDGGVTGAAAPKSSAIGIGWYYSLSPRTTVTTSYMHTKNNAETGRASFGQNKLTQATIGNDADPRGFSVGLNHTF